MHSSVTPKTRLARLRRLARVASCIQLKAVSTLKAVLLSLAVGAFANSANAQTSAPANNQATCPDLTPLYAQETPRPEDWARLEQQLSPLMSRCLQSSEYFALLGASLMNTGRLNQALEMLERALLLDPANGGAQVDYAQALYLQGQVFSAIDMNRQLLARNDLPPGLQSILETRASNWRSVTRQTSFQADVLVGYDTNLNGAPSPDQITLTLSGDPVLLPLDPEFQPKRGPYTNLRLGGRHRQLGPNHQHNVVVDLRGRISEDNASDLAQLDARYAFIRPGRARSWQLTTGVSHLMFGGRPLYTATEVGGRYVPQASVGVCKPFMNAAAQHQLFHNTSQLNAIESKAGVGLACPVQTRFGTQQVIAEVSALNNNSIRSGRAGGSRMGWQVNLDWQLEFGRGLLMTQLSHTEQSDNSGYSPILADGAKREIDRSYVLLQYQQLINEALPDTTLLLNLYHQKQRSNLELFRSRDSTIEIGLSHRF